MGRSPAVKSETFILEEFCGKTDVLDTLPMGPLKDSKNLSHRKKLAGGYPHLPFCPRLGQGSYL